MYLTLFWTTFGLNCLMQAAVSLHWILLDVNSEAATIKLTPYHIVLILLRKLRSYEIPLIIP